MSVHCPVCGVGYGGSEAKDILSAKADIDAAFAERDRDREALEKVVAELESRGDVGAFDALLIAREALHADDYEALNGGEPS